MPITLRQLKRSKLTIEELDNNFKYLERLIKVSTATATATTTATANPIILHRKNDGVEEQSDDNIDANVSASIILGLDNSLKKNQQALDHQ